MELQAEEHHAVQPMTTPIGTQTETPQLKNYLTMYIKLVNTNHPVK